MIAILAIAALTVPTALAARAPTAPPPQQTQVAAPAVPTHLAERRYCVEQVHSNSRLTKRECRTRAEWVRQGFDPLDQ